jgi:hypothetical protein
LQVQNPGIAGDGFLPVIRVECGTLLAVYATRCTDGNLTNFMDSEME